MRKNEKIFTWFDNKKIKEVLDGGGEYYIPDVTFRGVHDLLLILQQLLLWASLGNMEQASRAFVDYMYSLIDRNLLKKAVDLYLVYLLALRPEAKELAFDGEELRSKIVRLVRDNGYYVATDDSVRSAVLRLLDYFPELKLELGIK